MRRQFALLLTSVLLAFALTACGGDKDTHQDSGQSQTGGSTLEEDVKDEAHKAEEDVKDGIEDAKDGVEDAKDDIEDALTGDSRANHGSSAIRHDAPEGATFGQMLRNARVHDTDGFLKDLENPVSSGAV